MNSRNEMPHPVSSGSRTVVEPGDQSDSNETEPVLKLKLKNNKKKQKEEKKVGFSEDTIDNENMGKKKSKCCCIYKKSTVFGESSSESEDECENCYGHVEMKKAHRRNGGDDSSGGSSNREYLRNSQLERIPFNSHVVYVYNGSVLILTFPFPQ